MFIEAGSADVWRHKLPFRQVCNQKFDDKPKARIGSRMTAKRRKTKSGHVVGEQLDLYRSVDDCSVALESFGGAEQRKSEEELEIQNSSAAAQLLFVIKKHDATRLHYDLRLEWNWVLVSWAVPDGPSYCPEHKRKAIQVDDHAREHAGFEGVIPEGRPGAGTVMLWDVGTWQLQPEYTDAEAGLRDGYLKFTMHGRKIKGNWTLVRMASEERNQQRPIWWLSKDPDKFARSCNEPSILEEAPNGVIGGKSLEEIAEDWVKGKNKSTSQAEFWPSTHIRTVGNE